VREGAKVSRASEELSRAYVAEVGDGCIAENGREKSDSTLDKTSSHKTWNVSKLTAPSLGELFRILSGLEVGQNSTVDRRFEFVV
jgi:hypothetical protein